MALIKNFNQTLEELFSLLKGFEDDSVNVVAFVEDKRGQVHFLSSGHDLDLLYYAQREILTEMNRISEDNYTPLEPTE